MQDSDRRPASNPCPISMSQTSVLQIYALFSNSQIGVLFQILKSASNSQIYGRFSHFFNLTSNLRIPVIMNSVDADLSLKADSSLSYTVVYIMFWILFLF